MQDRSQIYCLKGFAIDHYTVSYVGKYYVWADQWPSKYRLPKYCNGQCVGMSADSGKNSFCNFFTHKYLS